MSFSAELRRLRKQDGLTQGDVARRLGIAKSTISMYECGRREPDFETLEAIADLFNVDMNQLTGHAASASIPNNIIPLPAMKTVPLLGTIACGEPILASENLEGDVAMPENVHADFALRCKGDSMINARIYNGDIVYIRQQDTVQDGEIAAVLVGDEATLKRVRIYADHVVLEPENPQFRPMAYWGEEAAAIRILGKAVAFTSSVR
ncbi:MAG: helix-turn-helix domain-containing protein [Oscillospiraceae bacterium]|nr:helix-turn-helix domain-containing protein [Oscillospiraceae bacterium]